jgi:hypothetical protein
MNEEPLRYDSEGTEWHLIVNDISDFGAARHLEEFVPLMQAPIRTAKLDVGERGWRIDDLDARAPAHRNAEEAKLVAISTPGRIAIGPGVSRRK